MRQGSLLLVGLLALTACSESLDEAPRLSDADVPEGVGGAAVAASDTGPEAPEADPQAAPRSGLLGFLRGQAEAAKTAEPAPEGEDVDVAALEPAGREEAEPQSGGFLSGLFGGGGGSGGIDLPLAVPGRQLPFGQVARNCSGTAENAGTQIDRYPETGDGYRLIDTNPGSDGMRTFFLTGFDDSCAVQFTAALAMFGSPEMHEQIRYGPAAATLPATALDSAYEAVKYRVCRVATGEPCGNRMGRLARDTAFVSIYQRFGGSRRKDLLLHDGQIVAIDTHDD